MNPASFLLEAKNWAAAYSSEQHGKVWRPLICWVLTEKGIVGMVPCTAGEHAFQTASLGTIPASSLPDFLGYEKVY